MATPKCDLLIARRVGQVNLGLLPHPHCLRKRGTPQVMVDLALHSLIGFDEEPTYLRAVRISFPLWTRNAYPVRTLYKCSEENLAIGVEAWLTMQEDLRQTPRCKVAIDALVQGLTNYVSR